MALSNLDPQKRKKPPGRSATGDEVSRFGVQDIKRKKPPGRIATGNEVREKPTKITVHKPYGLDKLPKTNIRIAQTGVVTPSSIKRDDKPHATERVHDEVGGVTTSKRNIRTGEMPIKGQRTIPPLDNPGRPTPARYNPSLAQPTTRTEDQPTTRTDFAGRTIVGGLTTNQQRNRRNRHEQRQGEQGKVVANQPKADPPVNTGAAPPVNTGDDLNNLPMGTTGDGSPSPLEQPVGGRPMPRDEGGYRPPASTPEAPRDEVRSGGRYKDAADREAYYDERRAEQRANEKASRDLVRERNIARGRDSLDVATRRRRGFKSVGELRDYRSREREAIAQQTDVAAAREQEGRKIDAQIAASEGETALKSRQQDWAELEPGVRHAFKTKEMFEEWKLGRVSANDDALIQNNLAELEAKRNAQASGLSYRQEELRRDHEISLAEIEAGGRLRKKQDPKTAGIALVNLFNEKQQLMRRTQDEMTPHQEMRLRQIQAEIDAIKAGANIQPGEKVDELNDNPHYQDQVTLQLR